MRIKALVLLSAALAACGPNDPSMMRDLPMAPTASKATNVVGQVYTMTNAIAGNTVVAFDRAADGTLTSAGSYPTGGAGTGAGLGNQSGVTLDESGSTLVVVNAGSNQLTSFHVNGDGTLEARSTVASGGVLPISVTISHDLVYALNAGGAGNISGFRLSSDGTLTPIAGSARALSTAASGPAQVAFDPSGNSLVVTEKATSRISTYHVDNAGLASGPTVTASSGTTPFGFGFTNSGTLIVSEAFGGAPNGSAVSSYRAAANDTWSVISASVPTTETAACWIIVSNDGRFAFTTNAGSGTVTGYAIHQGELTRLDADGVTGVIGAGSAPTEMALSRDGKFLYAAAGGPRAIAAFAVGHDGSLSPIAGGAGLPAGFNGLAAR